MELISILPCKPSLFPALRTFYPCVSSKLRKTFLVSPCYSLELSTQMGISFFFSFAFSFSSFLTICKASSDNLFAFLFPGDSLDHRLL